MIKIGQLYFKWIMNEVKGDLIITASKNSWEIDKLIKENKIQEAFEFFKRASTSSGKDVPQVAYQFFGGPTVEVVQKEKEIDNEFPEAVYNKITMQVESSNASKLIVKVADILTLPQIKAIINKIWEEDKKLIFILCPSTTLNGRIISDNLHFDNMELVKGYSKELGGDTQAYLTWIFGEIGNTVKGLKNKSVLNFRVHEYTFVSEKGSKYLIFSQEHLKTGKCKINGVLVPVYDRRKVGEEAKKDITIDVFFLFSYEPCNYELTKEKIIELRKKFNSHDIMAEKLFGKRRHPVWFERLMFSILYSRKDFGYPSHFLMVGPPGTGKTKGILNPLKISLDESKSPVSGNTSTIKGLIPSFKDNPPSIGHLCEADRVCLVDELFTFIGRANNEQGGRPVEGGNYFQLLKDILEHEEKDAMSGSGRTRVLMTAIMIAVTNPLEHQGLTDIPSLADKVDKAFLSRFLLYDQTEQHAQFVNDRKIMISTIGEDESYPVLDYDFVNLFDYTKTIRVSNIDFDRVNNIFKKYQDMIPVNLVDIYKARYQHHLLAIISGIAKYRYIIGEKQDLIFDDKDYEEGEDLFSRVIASWNKTNISDVPERIRLTMIPSGAKIVYDKICDMDYKAGIDDVPQLAIYCKMKQDEVNKWIAYLSGVLLLKMDNNTRKYVPFWYGTKQEKLVEVD